MSVPKLPIRGIVRGPKTTSFLCAGDTTAPPTKVATPLSMRLAAQKAAAFDGEGSSEKPDYSTYTPAHVWGIFKPLCNVANEDVLILTWGVQHPSVMEGVMKQWPKARVRLLVGYNRKEHNLIKLAATLQDWQAHGVSVRAIPSMHAKIWVVGSRVWVGSCNFVPNTIHNFMTEVFTGDAMRYAEHYWRCAKAFTPTTKLELSPQPTAF